MKVKTVFVVFIHLFFTLWSMSYAQPQSVPYSAKTFALDSDEFKSVHQNAWDLQKFYEMDDPKQAAKALRIHAQEYSIALDAYQPTIEMSVDKNFMRGKHRKSNDFLIHVFNGTEFIPDPGIEESLSQNVMRLSAESRSEEKLVCILQIQAEMTMGDIIELLEAGVKVYEQISSRSYLVRLPASSLDVLNSRAYTRWIGEYKPEYKYDVISSDSKRPDALIVSIDGDKPEHRADLKRMGITNRGYYPTACSYDVILDYSSFKEVAERLWWVKGIGKAPDIELLSANFEPDDSRELVNAFQTQYTGVGVTVGVL
ncbi:MAG: hypothetical protein ACXAC5_25460 [Promethearchaeota archaeon]|jgi:hypothetical protein